jgi:hypothetical protein
LNIKNEYCEAVKIIESMKKESKKMLKIIPINNRSSISSEKGKKI